MRSRTTRSAPGWTPRISRSPRVTIALIVEADGDPAACIARLSAQCDRTGSHGVVLTAVPVSADKSAVSRRVRVVSAPVDAGRAELRQLAMQQAEGDIVLLEEISGGRQLSVGGALTRDLADRTRSVVPVSEWRDILIAHGVTEVAVPRPSARPAFRAASRSSRETVPMMADAHTPA